MLVEQVAERAAAIVLAELAERQPEPMTPWLDGNAAAAAYLGWPLGRVEKLAAVGALPVHKVGRRNCYRRDELDAFVSAYCVGRTV